MEDNSLIDQLMTALEDSDLSATVDLIEKIETIPEKDIHHRSPLFFAVHSGQSAILRAILDKGVNAFARDKEGNTAMHVAARHGYTKMIPLLCEKQLEIDAHNFRGSTPLSLAILAHHTDCIKELVRAGADPFATVDGQTVIDNACQANTVEGFAALCESISPDSEKLREHLPILCTLATISGDLRLLLLLKKNFDCDFELLNSPPVEYSFVVQKLSMAGTNQEYLARFLQVESSGQHDVPLLAWAIAYEHEDIVDFLLKEGASVDQPIAPNGTTSLMWACIAGHKSMVDKLLQAGANKKTKDQKGRTAEEFIETYGYFFSHRMILKRLRA